MKKFRVAEKFVSRNGESRLAGELAVFIRFTGCGLRCSYCDTAWALSPDAPHELMSLEDIVDYGKNTGITNVTLTGGEPLMQQAVTDLVAELIGTNHKVEIETNGAVSIKELSELSDTLGLTDELSVTLDYKCPSSLMEDRMLMDNYDYLREYDTVKFVVGTVEDMLRAKEIIDRYSLIGKKIKVYLSPVYGELEYKDIVQFMMDNKMNGVRFQLQQHKIIWDPDMRGV